MNQIPRHRKESISRHIIGQFLHFIESETLLKFRLASVRPEGGWRYRPATPGGLPQCIASVDTSGEFTPAQKRAN